MSLADQVANFKKKLRGTGDGGRGVGDEGREKNSESWTSNPQSLRKKTPASGNVSETVSGRRRSPVRWPLSVPAPRRHYTTAGGFVSINWPMLAVGKCSVVSGCALEAVGAEAMVFDPSAAARCNAHHHHRKQ